MLSWNLQGRSAFAVLDPTTRHRIAHAHNTARCRDKPVLWVLEQLVTLESVGGLSGPLFKVEYFLCLVARVLQAAPDPAVVLAMLRQDVHKYLRVAALFIIRLIGNVAMQKEAVRVGWDDYRKIRVYGDEEEVDYVFDATLRGRKHPREGAAAAEAPSVNIEEAKPAHYFILCMDELTDRLFRVEQESERRPQFLGVPLPPLMFTPQSICTA